MLSERLESLRAEMGEQWFNEKLEKVKNSEYMEALKRRKILDNVFNTYCTDKKGLEIFLKKRDSDLEDIEVSEYSWSEACDELLIPFKFELYILKCNLYAIGAYKKNGEIVELAKRNKLER